MTDPEILFDVADGVAVVTLNRPKALNALTLNMVRLLDPQLAAWASDDAVRMVVVRGAGDRAFCAGGDIRALYDGGPGSAITCVKPDEITAANTTIPNAPRVNSRKITSSAKNTPAIGALKAAAIALAAPAATSRRRLSSERCSFCPKNEPRFAPIWTLGSSGPTDAPAPSDSAEASALNGTFQ